MSPNTSQQNLDEALRKWRTAEQRLYPLALAWPEGFEQHISLVRTVADRLGSVRTVEALLEAYGDWETITAAAAADELIPTRGLDLELTAGAAFCVRHREITAEARREETVRRIAEARSKGGAWTVIEQTHSPTGVPYPPWRRLEMHLPEGTGLHQWIEESLEGSGIEYGVELITLDPESGRWLTDRPPQERATFSDYDEWMDTVERLKGRVDSASVDKPTERGV